MKKALSIILALSMSISLAACGGNSQTSATSGGTEAAAAQSEAQNKDSGEKVLKIAQKGKPTTLGVLRADGYATSIQQNISDALTRLNDDLELEPGLATSWEWVDENTWQFKLREGVSFTNGEPFNAEAVAYNITSLTDRELSYRFASSWGEAWPISAEIVDENTVNIITSASNPFVPNLLTRIVMFAPEQWKAEGDDEYLLHPSGVGPYDVESWDVGISLTLKKSETEYWDGEPYFDEIIIDAVTSDASRISALQAGEYDLIEGVPYDQVAGLQQNSDLKMVTFESVGLDWFYFNGYAPADNWVWNVKFREAIAHAIDQEGISATLFGGICPVLQGPAFKGSYGGNTDTQAYSYDPELSKQLLSEIGYDGTVMRFFITEGEFPNDIETAEFITSQLQEVGINVELNQVDTSILDETRKSGNCELCMINTPGPFGGTSDYYWTQMSEKRGYSNGEEFAEIGERYAELSKYGIEENERERMLTEMNEALWERVPVLFSVSSNMVLGMDSELQGVRYAPNSWLYFKNAYYE